MKNKTKLIILSLILIFLIILIVFIVYIAFTPIHKPLNKQKYSFNKSELNSFKVNSDIISYILYSFDAETLHNSPLSLDTPKIMVVVDNENYYSEIVDGEIKTNQIPHSQEDIVINIPESEIIKVLNSTESSKIIQQSISSKLTTIEIKASYVSLLTKGYYGLYKKFTGKELNN